MSANIVERAEGYYIQWLDSRGKVVDQAGPFDEIEDAEAAADRGEF